MRPIHLLTLAAVLAVPSMLLADTTRVAVTKTQVLGGTASHAWLGTAVQENLIIEIGRLKTVDSGRTFEPAALRGTDIGSGAAAMKAGLAVTSTAQIVGDDVRLTAQVLRVDVGGKTSVVATATATGAQRELLKVQDELTTQLRTAVVGAPAGRVLVVDRTPVREMVAERPATYTSGTGLRTLSGMEVPDISLTGAMRTASWAPGHDPYYYGAGYAYYSLPSYGYYYRPHRYHGHYGYNYQAPTWNYYTTTYSTTQSPVKTPNGGRAWPPAHGNMGPAFSGGLR